MSIPTTYASDVSIAAGLIDMSFQPDILYNDLLPLPPRVGIETKAFPKARIFTSAASAELKTSGQLILNQALLVNSTLLLEAQ